MGVFSPYDVIRGKLKFGDAYVEKKHAQTWHGHNFAPSSFIWINKDCYKS